MFKVNADRNVFFEINLKLLGIAYTTINDTTIFGLRKWFDVTNSIEYFVK